MKFIKGVWAKILFISLIFFIASGFVGERTSIPSVPYCLKAKKIGSHFPQYIETLGNYELGGYQSYVPLPYPPEEWHDLYTFDENGIVMVYIKQEQRYSYNPVTISQYALANLKQYTDTGKDIHRKIFLDNARYLREHYKLHDDGSISYPYDFDHMHSKAGWHSAMAQGQVLTVLAYEYKMTGEAEILTHMKRVKRFMLRPLEKGGTLSVTPEGYPWLEEFAIAPSGYILNGAIFALMGLYDYVTVVPDDREAADILQKIIIGIKQTLPLYDTGSWVLYDRVNDKYLNYRYMEFQVIQMYQLYQITQDEHFKKYYHQWKKYYRSCSYLK